MAHPRSRAPIWPALNLALVSLLPLAAAIAFPRVSHMGDIEGLPTAFGAIGVFGVIRACVAVALGRDFPASFYTAFIALSIAWIPLLLLPTARAVYRVLCE